MVYVPRFYGAPKLFFKLRGERLMSPLRTDSVLIRLQNGNRDRTWYREGIQKNISEEIALISSRKTMAILVSAKPEPPTNKT